MRLAFFWTVSMNCVSTVRMTRSAMTPCIAEAGSMFPSILTATAMITIATARTVSVPAIPWSLSWSIFSICFIANVNIANRAPRAAIPLISLGKGTSDMIISAAARIRSAIAICLSASALICSMKASRVSVNLSKKSFSLSARLPILSKFFLNEFIQLVMATRAPPPSTVSRIPPMS